MSISKAKRARLQRAKRIEQVRKTYPRWPAGVIESNWERGIGLYVDTGDTSQLPAHVTVAAVGGAG